MEQRIENEELFQVVKDFHKKEELSNVVAQHPHLLPKLRPYQEKAVGWMVHRETQPVIENIFLNYVSSEQTPSISVGGAKSLHVVRIPTGGILSDEMGLGKTVEVLACILINQRIGVEIPLSRRSKQGRVVDDSSSEDEFENVPLVLRMANNKKGQRKMRAKRRLKVKETIISGSSSTAVSELTTNESSDSLVELGSSLPEHLGVVIDQDELKVKLEADAPIILGENPKVTKTVTFFKEEDEEQDAGKKDEDGFSAMISNRTYQKAAHNAWEEIVETKPNISGFSVSETEQDESIRIATGSVKRKSKSKYDDPLWEVSSKKTKLSITKRKASALDVNIVDPKKKSSKQSQKSALKRQAQEWYESKLSEVKRNPIQAYRQIIEESEDYNRNIDVQCICGGTNRGHLLKCDGCSRLLHKKCIGASKWIGMKRVYCPQCWLKQTPIPSRATLIVSPTSISGQWLNEVKKHVSPKAKFKVLHYKGVKSDGFLQPYEYSKYDLILTTYDVLRRELDIAEVHERRGMRYEKRYFSPTCPLLCIDFWRICLDEAQMVEGHASKAAEMVSRLTSVHRWAVTGTPIQKSFQDLYGLVMFLNVEPFCALSVWRSELLNPYSQGVKNPFFTLIAHIMWRSSKADVLDQIKIPPQSELLWPLNFSPIEEHFYRRTHQECANDFLQMLSRFGSLDIPLHSLKLVTVNSVLNPLLRLRQACSHPQAVRGNVITNQRSTMTMPELLESLIKKTTIEAQDALRKHIASLNGLAGLHIIAHEYVSAAEKYREVLRITEDYKDRVKVDTLQKIHTLHNLAQIIASHRDHIPPTLRDDQLHDECRKLEETYLNKAQILVTSAEDTLSELTESAEKCRVGTEKDDELNWWYDLIQCLDRDETLGRVHDALVNHRKSVPNVSSTSIINKVSTIGGVQLTCNLWLEDLEKHELSVRQKLDLLRAADFETLMNKAVDCHLRISSLKSKSLKRSCELCLCEDTLKKYEIDLFDIKTKKNENIMVGDVYLLGETKEGSWKPSEQETVLKTVLTFGKQKKGDQDLLKAGTRFFKFMDALRKEFKSLRLLWSRINEMTQARDELNMCKLRLRLRLPHEATDTNKTVNKRKKQPNVNNQLSSNLDTKLENLHIIDAHQVEQVVHQNEIEAVSALSELRKKAGTVSYLQNLRQKGENDSKPDLCPVCQLSLVHKWAVLSCGHCYCMDCIPELFKIRLVHCAVCRETTLINEVSFVNSSPDSEEADCGASTSAPSTLIPCVQGSHSTKVEAIVKRIFYLRAADPSVKILIFSTWDRVLNVLQDVLDQNGVRNLRLKPGANYENTLQSFKDTENEDTITVLLLLLKFGSKGLNLIEATHVMMVEPLLNPADELQAIGRVHRIGQTRPTFVHRFLIKESIEDRIFSAVKATGKELWSHKQVTLRQLKDLFSSSSDGIPEVQEC